MKFFFLSSSFGFTKRVLDGLPFVFLMIESFYQVFLSWSWLWDCDSHTETATSKNANTLENGGSNQPDPTIDRNGSGFVFVFVFYSSGRLDPNLIIPTKETTQF